MARLVRRAKRVEGKRTRVLEVLETDKERKRRKREEPVKKKEEPKRKVTVLPTIEAKRKETGIQKFAKTRVGKVLTSPKTTAALALTLAGGVGLAARGVAAVGKAVITRTAIKGKVSLTTQRAFVGRSAKSGVDKIFHKTREVARRFGTNKKSMGLTTSLLSRVVKNPAFIIGAIGSYPFAYFLKEEALQTLGIPLFKAVDAGDLAGAEELTEAIDEMLAGEDEILSWVPYANVVEKLVGKNGFFAAAAKANNEWKRLIAQKRGELEFEGTSVGEDIAARDIRQQEIQEERDIEFKESEEKREERDIEFKEAEKERAEQREERDREFLEKQEERDEADRNDSAYFEVLRQMKAPFPGGTPIEQIDPEIVAAARKSNLFFEGQF